MGLSRDQAIANLKTSTLWSADELARLREAYAVGGVHAAAEVLPGRAHGAIFRRARADGIKRRARWTPGDDARLRRMWDGSTPIRTIAETLGRTAVSVYWRARVLHLPLGCPDGWEYLSSAATRTGYQIATLRRILKWRGVEPIRVLTVPVKARGKTHRKLRLPHIVAPGDVDAAVSAWLETEPVETAARRLGISGPMLRDRLRRAGVKCKSKRACHWRVSPDEISAAMAFRRVGKRLVRVGGE